MSVVEVKLEPDEWAVLEVIAESEGKQPEEKMREFLRDGAIRFLGGRKQPEPQLSDRDRALKRLGVNVGNGN